MPSTAIPSTIAAAPPVAPRWGAWLQRTWDRFSQSDDDRFLHDARDLIDLEARLRRLEQGRACRFDSLPPLP